MLHPKIIELSSRASIKFESGCFYFYDKNIVCNYNLAEIFTLQSEQYPFFLDNNFWIADYNANTTRALEGTAHFVLPFFISEDTLIINENFYLIEDEDEDEEALIKYEKSGNLVNKVESEFRYICSSNQSLFTYTAGALQSYNLDLNALWEVETDKRCFPKSSNGLAKPQYYASEGLVIINFGEHRALPRGEFEINAYHAKTGELAWQQIVSTTPDCAALYGDKVYAIVRDEILILDAATGNILHQVAHGLNDPKDDYPMVHFIYPCEQGLMLVSPKHGLVQIRTEDGSIILQDIHVPLPYTTSFHPPITYQGKTYLSLTHADSYDNTMKGAILVLDNDVEINDKKAQKSIIKTEAQIAPRPPISVELIKHESGSDVYQVTIEHDADKPNPASKTLDDLIRFSTIALKETAFKYGSYTSSTETNNNHHGQLLLSVKSEVLKKTEGLSNEELLGKLQVIKERVERNLADTGVQAGDGSSAFVVDIRLAE